MAAEPSSFGPWFTYVLRVHKPDSARAKISIRASYMSGRSGFPFTSSR